MSETDGVKKEMRRGRILNEYIETVTCGNGLERRLESYIGLTYISCTMWIGGSSESNHAVEVEDWVVNPVVAVVRGHQCEKGRKNPKGITSARA